MDSNITKVNVEQVNNLVNKLTEISKTVSASIQSYRNNLSVIEKTGYLRGIAEESIHMSCDKISAICTEFDEYAAKIAKELNEVVGQTQQIEKEEKNNIEDIISQDPTTFSGTKSGSSTSAGAATTGALTAGGAVAASNINSNSDGNKETGAQSTNAKPTSIFEKIGQQGLTNYTSPYSDSNVKNEQEVYKYLTEEMGLNDAAAAGVMANIYAESRFSTNASGDAGSSYGMFQVHAGRKTNLISWCEKYGYDPSTVGGQMARFEEEVTKAYPKTESALYNAVDSVSGARSAASVVTTDFERPSNASSKAVYRANLAEQYYKKIKASKW